VWLAEFVAEQRRATKEKGKKERGNEALAFAFKARQRTLKKMSKKTVVKYVYLFMRFLLLLTVKVDVCHRACLMSESLGRCQMDKKKVGRARNQSLWWHNFLFLHVFQIGLRMIEGNRKGTCRGGVVTCDVPRRKKKKKKVEGG